MLDDLMSGTTTIERIGIRFLIRSTDFDEHTRIVALHIEQEA